MPNWEFETTAIHAGSKSDKETGATKVPIYQSAAFEHDTAESLEATFKGRQFGYYYSRVSNPTIVALEQRLNALEGGRGAVVVSSGMAAISSVVLTLARSGDNIVVAKSLFGSTYYLLKGLVQGCGVELRFVDTTSIAAYESAIDSKTRLVFLEAIGNPKLDVPDISLISKCAHGRNVPVAVDTTFVTPYLFNGKTAGADIIVQATTKYLCGGGSTIGGALIDTGAFKWATCQSESIQEQSAFGDLAFLSALRKHRSNAGCVQAPQNAFITGLGLDTLVLRMDRHCENALACARYFQEKKADVPVDVAYPGLPDAKGHKVAQKQFGGRFGGMLTIRLGSKERAFRFINALKLVKNLVNLGDSKTLAVHPESTIYRHLNDKEKLEAGVTQDLIRISTGLEHSQDIIDDFEQALSCL